MRKALLSLASASVLLACTAETYDDSGLQKRMGDLESRVDLLEQTCNNLNTNIVSVSTAMANVQKNYTVEGITETSNGYAIKFTNGQTVVISNGIDGDKGDKGDRGEKGDEGKMPVVGVAKEGESYFWTVNGEFLKDASGNKVSASAGAAIAPKFKVEGQQWFVSNDAGSSWEQVEGATVGTSITVTEDEYSIFLTFSDNTVVTLPKTSSFAVKLAENFDFEVKLGAVNELAYTVTNADATTRVFADACGVVAEVVATDANSGVIKLTVPDVLPEGAYVIVKAVKVTTSEYSAQYVTFVKKEDAVLTVATTAYEIPAQGGLVEVPVSTNVEYTVTIPAEAAWLTKVSTKAVRNETIVFSATANEGDARTAAVTLSAADVAPVTITFVQAKGAPSDQVGPNLAEDQCIDVDAASRIIWNMDAGKKNVVWTNGYPAVDQALATLTWIGEQTFSLTSVNKETTVGAATYYAMGAKYEEPYSMSESDGFVLSVPVKDVAKGSTLKLHLPFRISGTGPTYYNLEVSLNGYSWELMKVVSNAYSSDNGVSWIEAADANGLSYTTLLEKKPANVKIYLKGVGHMIEAEYVLPKHVIQSEIKIRLAAVDVFDTMNYETELETNPEAEVPTFSRPSAYFCRFMDIKNPGVMVYEGPVVEFVK